MVKNHLKSLSAPKTWAIKRKEQVYILRPRGSGQKQNFCMPIGIVFKEMLKYCKTSKEVKIILAEKNILVDGKKVKKIDDSIGLFSTLSITATNEYFRLTINKNGKLELKKIDKADSILKPSVIKNKKIIGKGKIQLNMTDGRNMLIKKDDYQTGDTLIITLPEQEVKQHLKLGKGITIILTGGKHIGSKGTIEEITDNKIKFISEDEKTYETEKRYAVAIGEKKAIITV